MLGLEPLVQKWQAFGFHAKEIDGHDFRELHAALAEPPGDRPLCIVARTVKGKGVRLMEGKLEWHYLPMSDEQPASDTSGQHVLRDSLAEIRQSLDDLANRFQRLANT